MEQSADTDEEQEQQHNAGLESGAFEVSAQVASASSTGVPSTVPARGFKVETRLVKIRKLEACFRKVCERLYVVGNERRARIQLCLTTS